MTDGISRGVSRATSVQEIPLGEITPHPLNARSDVGDLTGLAASIREHGVLEPIIVSKNGRGFFAIAGRRRLEASRLAGRASIPAIVREGMSDSDVATATLIENLQRQDLTPLEEAEAYRAWLDLNPEASQRDLARELSRDESTISNALRLLKAPAAVREALVSKAIGGAHARELLKIADESLFAKVKLKKGATVRDVQDQVRTLNADWQNAGAPAVAAAKQFLAAARAKHPKATITWPLARDSRDRVVDVVDLVEALGKQPAGIFGQVHNAKTHDKACECRAYELDVLREYVSFDELEGDDRFDLKGFELRRTCIDRGGWAKYQAADRRSYGGGGSSTAPRKKSPAALAKERAKREREFRETVRSILAGGGRYGGPRYAPASVEKILTGGGFTSEKATRVVFLSYVLERVGGSAELLAVVRKALTMKDRELRALILRFAAHEVNSRLLSEGKTTSPYNGQLAAYEFLKAYGQKIAEPKPKDRAKQKAKSTR